MKISPIQRKNNTMYVLLLLLVVSLQRGTKPREGATRMTSNAALTHQSLDGHGLTARTSKGADQALLHKDTVRWYFACSYVQCPTPRSDSVVIECTIHGCPSWLMMLDNRILHVILWHQVNTTLINSTSADRCIQMTPIPLDHTNGLNDNNEFMCVLTQLAVFSNLGIDGVCNDTLMLNSIIHIVVTRCTYKNVVYRYTQCANYNHCEPTVVPGILNPVTDSDEHIQGSDNPSCQTVRWCPMASHTYKHTLPTFTLTSDHKSNLARICESCTGSMLAYIGNQLTPTRGRGRRGFRSLRMLACMWYHLGGRYSDEYVNPVILYLQSDFGYVHRGENADAILSMTPDTPDTNLHNDIRTKPLHISRHTGHYEQYVCRYRIKPVRYVGASTPFQLSILASIMKCENYCYSSRCPCNRAFRKKLLAEYMQYLSWDGVWVYMVYSESSNYNMYIETVDLVERINPNQYERERPLNTNENRMLEL